MGGSHIEVDAKFTGKRSIYTHAVDLRHRSNFIRGQTHLWWQYCVRQLLTQDSTRVHFFGKLTTPNRAQQSDITVSDNCTRRREAPAHIFGYAQQFCSQLRNNKAVKIGESDM